MDFGKLPSVDRVDFALPPDDPRNRFALPGHRLPRPNVMVGAPAWGEPRWRGTVYPHDATTADFLRHYSRQFATIELNSTFYGIPREATVRKWREQVPQTFRFCPKVVRDASHEPVPRLALAALHSFTETIAELGDRLGACFLQMPPEVGPLERARLRDLLAAWPPGMQLCVELRHESWYRGGHLVDSALALLQEFGVGTVITDVAGRRDVCHSTLSSDLLMLRLVGNDMHPTDAARAVAWSERLATWIDAGLHTAYVFAHQPDNVRAAEFAAILTGCLRHHSGLELPAWHPVATQLDLF